MTVFVIIAALSGASALIFENLWFRAASIALGSGVWSTAVVLSAFMAGLAAGSLGAMWFEARLERPMRVYAWIEIAIGASGLTVLVLFPFVSSWLTPAFAALVERPLAVNVLRLSAAFFLLAMPAAAMGATLPVLMRALAASPETFGGKLGRIYGANTVGAVAGVLVCEVMLVPTIGVAGAGCVAAALNGLAALLAFQTGALPARPAEKRAKAAIVRDRELAIGRGPLLAAGFASGAIFLAFEVATFRFLLLFFTALNTNFAVMLAVVLLGVALGGLAGVRLFRRHPVGVLIPAVAALSGASLALSYRFFPIALRYALTLPPFSAVFVATMAFALPVSLLSGLLFAALGHGLRQAKLGETAATGLLTAVNTIGAAIGSLITGFYLIGWIGLERSFQSFVVGYGAMALGLLAATPRAALALRHRSRWTAVAIAVIGMLAFPSGTMQAVFHEFPINQLSHDGERRVALKEGQLETLQYLRTDIVGRPDYFRLITNNHSMAATDLRSRRYMRLFAHLPSILHPAPARAAQLGLGLGVTATALTEDTRFRSIDIVDVSRDISAMLPTVYPERGTNPLDDPRVRFHLEDGRFFLATTAERFDVITAEPPPPHYAGVANLYSREFFQLVADRLRPGGIATYWLPVHDLKADEARAILAAFLDAFPEASLWTGSGLEWIMLGLKPPGGGVSDEAFGAWWTRAPVADRLREIGLETPGSLGSLFIADGARLRAWIGSVPPLTDNFPRRISLDAARDVADSAAFVTFMSSRERVDNFMTSPLIGSLWPSAVRAATASQFSRESVVDAILSLPALGPADIDRALSQYPRDPLLVKALFWRHYFDFDRTQSLLEAEPGLQGTGFAEYRAQLALMNGNPREAADWLSRSTSPRADELLAIRAYCLMSAGDRAGAEALLRSTIK